MSLPVFLVDPATVAAVDVGDIAVLAGPEGRHAATVRRIGPGESVQFVDGTGRRITGTVQAAGREDLRVVVERVEVEPSATPRFVLVQALAKGDRDDQAVEAAVELGADAIVPWQAQRSIVQWRGERGERARRKWVDTVRSATKQSRRARLAEVADVVDLRRLTALVAASSAAYVLHEEAREPLAGQHLPEEGDVLVIVGPEGGITPTELDGLRSAGARVVRLGSTVLRSSSAGPAALAVLSAGSRWR